MSLEFLRGPFLLIVMALIVTEAVYMIFVGRRGYDVKSAAASFGVAAGNIVVRPLTSLLILSVFPFVETLAIWHLPADSGWVWLAGFLGVEFTYYWMHRFSHTIRWLWASHCVHHSSPAFTLPSAIRLGWTNALSGEWLMFLPLVLLGFPPAMIAVLLATNLAYQFFLHTELSPPWGPLGYVFNSPDHHRVHHASNTRFLDKNFGGVLIVFDRLFGTFAIDDGVEPLRFGLAGLATSYNPFVIALREWARMFADLKKAKTPRQSISTLFGPPK